MTRAEVIFEGYQRQEDPSIPYTPCYVWETMKAIKGVQIFGNKPEAKWEHDHVHPREGGWRDPLTYHATFNFHSHRVKVIYQWLEPNALLVALGDEKNFDAVRDTIFTTHRLMKRSPLEEMVKQGVLFGKPST